MVKFSCVREDLEWVAADDDEDMDPVSTSFWVDPEDVPCEGDNVDCCNTCGEPKYRAVHIPGGPQNHKFVEQDRWWYEVDDLEEAAKFILEFPYAVWDWCEGEAEQDFRTGVWTTYTLFVDDENQAAVFEIADKMNDGRWSIEKANNDVYKGIQLLDEKTPGWRENIDLVSLDLHSECQCVLGQIYGNYHRGCLDLGISGEQYGFDVSDFDIYGYETLQRAWEGALNA